MKMITDVFNHVVPSIHKQQRSNDDIRKKKQQKNQSLYGHLVHYCIQ